MTICNMSIEGGARAGLIAPDQTTFEYMRGRPQVPQGDAFEAAVEQWSALATDPDATYDTLVEIDASALSPFVTWGTNPGMVVPITGRVPDPASLASPTERAAAERALEYMGLQPNTPMQDIYVDNVFIGSCTNSRIEDLRAAAAVVKGRKTHPKVQAMVVPGVDRGEDTGGVRGSGPYLQRRGPRLEGGRLLHVPWHEPGHPSAAAEVRLHIQPQLRGTAGARWTHPSVKPPDGRRSRDCRPLRGHPRMGGGVA